MMAEGGSPLGLRLRLLSEGPETSAALVVPATTVGDYTDAETLSAFAVGLDAITFDHEHVPTGLLAALEAEGTSIRPGPDALIFAQDKAAMRAKLTELGVPCPTWRVVSDEAELLEFADEIGWPVIAKTSRGGYDGKGVWKIDTPDAARVPFEALRHALGPTERDTSGEAAADGVVIVAEEYVPFTRELSVLIARRPGGEAVAYPVTETVQRSGICFETITPAPGLDASRSAAIEAIGRRIAAELDVVGILAVELMERPNGEFVINELAMRPHNTGHWTIEGAATSQFENHLRAVADLPLGPATLRDQIAVMTNVLGGSNFDLFGSLPVVLADPSVHVHLYGKAVKPGRKVGHVTVTGNDLDAVRNSARLAAGYLEGNPE